MKNIAIIIQKLYGGGAERTASNLSILLSKRNNVHLIVFDGRNIKYPYSGVLHDLKIPPAGNKLGKLINLCKRILAVRRIKQENNIDVAISLMAGANLVNILSKYNPNEKIITSIRTYVSKTLNGVMAQNIVAWQTKFISKHSNVIVSLSNGVKSDLIEKFNILPSTIVTIYNPCDRKRLIENAKLHLTCIKGMPSNSIVTMGRLVEPKGQWHLIRALKIVVEVFPDVRLYILGTGPLERPLKQLVKDLQLEGNVTFLGFQKVPHAYIMKAKVFAFSSLYEGLGNALLEAIACGVPCVSTDCYSGPREMLAPGTKIKEQLEAIEYAEFGILVSAGDKGHFDCHSTLTIAEKQLAEAIIKLLADDNLQMQYAEKATIRSDDFLPEVIATKWEKIIYT